MEPAVGSLQSGCTRTALLVVSAAVITPVSLSVIMTKTVTCDGLGERGSTGLMISQALEKYGATGNAKDCGTVNRRKWTKASGQPTINSLWCIVKARGPPWKDLKKSSSLASVGKTVLKIRSRIWCKDGRPTKEAESTVLGGLPC